jgi:endonuclease-3
MKKTERVDEIIRRLEQAYPDALCSLEYEKPHELMIAGRLSAQCTDARVNIVTKELFARYKSIEDFANADVNEVAEIVKPCGLYKTKAKSIVGMCRQIMQDYGGKIPDTIEELTKLEGIGRKTANLVLGDVFHKPAVVCDTHCIRICGRLGLTKNTDPQKVETDLRRILPPEKSSDFCHRMVLFGRQYCKARGERCSECPLSDICKREAGKQKQEKTVR